MAYGVETIENNMKMMMTANIYRIMVIDRIILLASLLFIRRLLLILFLTHSHTQLNSNARTATPSINIYACDVYSFCILYELS